MDISLSRYGMASSTPAPVNAMMASFAQDFRDGVDINLGVGYVNERTIPKQRIIEAVQAVAAHPEAYRQAFNYGGPHGSATLIASLRRFYRERRIGGITDAALERTAFVIGANGATSLLDAVADVLEPGIVVTAQPLYYIYTNALERKGYRILGIPEDEDGMAPDALDEMLDALGPGREQISFFYFVTVNNPTCALLSNAMRRRIVAAAARLSRALGRKIPVIFDLAYELLLHDPEAPPFESALNDDPLGMVYEVGTLSKVLAPALRIGYMAGPPGPFLDAIVQKTSDVGFSAPLLNQEVASYLLDTHIGEQLAAVNAGYRAKAVAVRAAIERELGPYLAGLRGGRAGFYFYLTFREVETHSSSTFFQFLARTTGDPEVDGPSGARLPRVVYIPGEYCYQGDSPLLAAGRRQLRLSYGFEEVAAIEAALTMMREAAAYALGRR